MQFSLTLAALTLATVLAPAIAVAQGAEVRSLDEVKAEVMRRAGKINPFDAVKPDEARAILDNIKTLDKDEWAREWCKVGLEHEKHGDERARAGAPSKELAEIYHSAFAYCMLGRYPVASSPGKREAYQHSVRQYRKAGPHLDPPLQVVEIPFEGKKLVGYLRIPKGVTKPPVVMNWGGVDEIGRAHV